MINRLSQTSIMRLIALSCSIMIGCVVVYSMWGAAEDFRSGTTFVGEPYNMTDLPILLAKHLVKTFLSFVIFIFVILIGVLMTCIPFICLHALKETEN